MTVREHIAAIRKDVADPSLTPDRAAVLLNQLSALLSNVNVEIREADVAFNLVFLDCLKAEKAANRAKVVAETTPEYLRKREARDTKEVVTEMIGALKYQIRVATEEMRLSR